MTTKTTVDSNLATPPDNRTFDGSLRLLETIVRQLESGELPLERALDLFEQGIALARHCQSHLEAAERRVEVLLQDKGGTVRLTPYQAESTSRKPSRPAAPSPSSDDGEEEEEEDLEDEEDDSDLPF
jgi:exodeoxyribonuclease VII small subunit